MKKVNHALLLIIYIAFSAVGYPQNPPVTKPISKDVKPVIQTNLSIQSLQPGKYIIKTATSLKAIDIDRGTINSSSPKIQIWDACADYKKSCEPQIWLFASVAGRPNHFIIKLTANGKLLTVNPFKKTELVLANRIGNDKVPNEYQTWLVKQAGSGRFVITSALKNMTDIVSVATTAENNGSPLSLQKPCANPQSGCDNQLFTFFKIPEAPKICDAYPAPDAAVTPSCTNCEVGVSTQPLVAATSKMWQPGSTLRVRMDGGSALVRSKVVQYANEWTRYANIRFNFIPSGDAEIIVTFGNDGHSWSYVGRDCIDPGRRFLGNFTMNGTTHFGWFDDATPEDEFRRVILHEFGHVLGFKHEQSHPDGGIPWDREATYAHFAAKNPPWGRDEVNRQVFEIASRSETQFSSYDRTSIMQYAVPNELTIGDFEIGWNTTLSETDKAFARLMYPPGNITGNKLRIKIGTGGDDVRVNSNVLIYLKLNNAALPEFRKSLNNGNGWGGNSSNVVEIGLPAGVNITDIQECKLLFTSGKQFEWDTPDNWNLDRLTIDFITADGFRSNMVERSGTPYVRFYNTGEVLLLRR